MEENFNRQFIMIDFDTLDDEGFQALVGGVFATYCLLRKRIWRSHKPNLHGLHERFAAGDLCAALSQEELAHKLDTTERNVRRFIKALKDRGLVKALYTGRGNIYKLGEVVQVRTREGQSVRKEIYYLDVLAQHRGQDSSALGGPKASARSGPFLAARGGRDRSAQGIDNDRDQGIEKGDAEGKEEGEAAYLAAQIVACCGDRASRPFYARVARHLPSDVVYQFLSEIRQDPSIRSRGAVFTAKAREYLARHAADPRLRGLIGSWPTAP